MAKVYGVGVGPGDSGLVTVKAVEIIQACPVVAVPVAAEGRKSVAKEIVEPYLKEEHEILEVVFPMVKDRDELEAAWEKGTAQIADLVKRGQSVVMPVLGDPTFYSTYMYLVPYLQKLGIEVETVPGVTSFSAIAAQENVSLGTWDEKVAIFPYVGDNDHLDVVLKDHDNVVIMKPSHDIQSVAELLEKHDLQENFVLISKASTGEQNSIRSIEALKSSKIPYLSTIITKRKGL